MYMKSTPILLAIAALLAGSISSSKAQSYYVRGSFNNWGNTPYVGGVPLNDNLDGSYSLTVDGLTYSLTNGTRVQFKVLTDDDWGKPTWPGSNCSSYIGTNGVLTIHFRPGNINDGYSPSGNRVGYDDSQQHDWSLYGNFQGAYADVATLTDAGNGVHTVNYVVTNAPGTYQFKFRRPPTFDTMVGTDFGSGSLNISVTTTQANQTLAFTLDLPNGRWVVGSPLQTPTNWVSFVCDMQVPIALYDQDLTDPNGFDTNSENPHVRGSFNAGSVGGDWQLFQVPGTTLYSNTVPVEAFIGDTVTYKFWKDYDTGQYEQPALLCEDPRDRSLTITNASMSAPPAYWCDRKLSDPDINISFAVDMSLQESLGFFTNGVDSMYVRGSLSQIGWGPGILLTNHPAPYTNVFSTVVTMRYTPIPPCVNRYKFYIDRPPGGTDVWESPISTGGNDREFTITSTSVAISNFWNGLTPCDTLEEETQVTFSVDMTGAVSHPNGTITYDGTQTVYINGEFLSWQSQVGGGDWGTNPKPELALTKNPTSDVHSITLPISAASKLQMVYKFSMGGEDNEAGQQTNHVRYIRLDAGSTNYTMPRDVWTITNPGVPRVEPEIGGLAARASTPGNVVLEWSGLPCTSMQAGPTPAGPFSNLFEARGVSSTNMPVSGEQMYFRLSR